MYRPSRNYIALDALSRLQGIRDTFKKTDLNTSELKDIPVLYSDADIKYRDLDKLPAFFTEIKDSSNYVIIVLRLLEDFKTRYKEGYEISRLQRRLKVLLKEILEFNEASAETRRTDKPTEGPYVYNSLRPPRKPLAFATNLRRRKGKNGDLEYLQKRLDKLEELDIDLAALEGLRFFLEDDLIFYIDLVTRQLRLCIPLSCQYEIFEGVYDYRHYYRISRYIDRITASFYIKDYLYYVKEYLNYYPEYKLNAILRYLLNGFLNPIDLLTLLIDVQYTDQIVKLPLTNKGFDSLLTVTYKKLKRVLLIPSKGTQDAKTQVAEYLLAIQLRSQLVIRVLILDRDLKQLSEFF